jgi:hypothetical protein
MVVVAPWRSVQKDHAEAIVTRHENDSGNDTNVTVETPRDDSRACRRAEPGFADLPISRSVVDPIGSGPWVASAVAPGSRADPATVILWRNYCQFGVASQEGTAKGPP